jgi:hypothetical protein
MKFLIELANYFFPHDSEFLSLTLLATFVSILSCGIVAIGLWIVHAPPTPAVSGEVHRGGAQHCENR